MGGRQQPAAARCARQRGRRIVLAGVLFKHFRKALGPLQFAERYERLDLVGEGSAR